MGELDDPTELISVLVRLRQALVEGPIPFAADDAEHARAERGALVKQLDDYIIPRLVQVEAPLLAVVGGSTGAGKSTLVNSLVGERVTHAGVLRPTTRSPVLVHNRDDAHWFGTDRLLPELERTDHMTNDQGTLQLVATDNLPTGIALLDAPDVDSIEERNRELAAELLAAADLWIFVTSASRYADEVPWDFLKAAAQRGTAVAMVLDRTTAKAVREVSSHLARMLTARGLGDSPLFTVAESEVDDQGLLPYDVIAAVREWLDSLAVSSGARALVIRKTLDGALTAVGQRARVVSTALREQEQIAAQLREDAYKGYAGGLADVEEATQDGTLLRGEVLARWQEFVGNGELMRSLEDRVGRIRDRLMSAARGKPMPAQRLTLAIEASLRTLIVEHAESAAERTGAAWRHLPAGAQLMSASPTLERTSHDFDARVEQCVRDWQDDVLALVRAEGADRRATARFLAYGVNGLGVALMVGSFAQASGMPGSEGGAAGGAAAVGRKILEAVFGEPTVRRLVQAAIRSLHERIETVWVPERQRFVKILDAAGLAEGAAQRVLEMSREVEDTRWEARQA